MDTKLVRMVAYREETLTHKVTYNFNHVILRGHVEEIKYFEDLYVLN